MPKEKRSEGQQTTPERRYHLNTKADEMATAGIAAHPEDPGKRAQKQWSTRRLLAHWRHLFGIYKQVPTQHYHAMQDWQGACRDPDRGSSQGQRNTARTLGGTTPTKLARHPGMRTLRASILQREAPGKVKTVATPSFLIMQVHQRSLDTGRKTQWEGECHCRRCDATPHGLTSVQCTWIRRLGSSVFG